MSGSERCDRLAFMEQFVIKYEYKVIYNHSGEQMPWASQEIRDTSGRRGLEKSLNALAEEGWEIVSCTSSALGSFLNFSPMTTVILRREKP
jgi:Domain of unknown function (DUF4177)